MIDLLANTLGAPYLLAREILGPRIASYFNQWRGVIMPTTEGDSFGYLPWIVILVTVIAILVLYIVVGIV
jgi:hypothetical protein